MSRRGEMWVHGNSVIVQYPGGNDGLWFTDGHRMLNASDPAGSSVRVPWSDLLGIRRKDGATFRGSWGTPGNPNLNWFHFSIPTPAFFPRPDVGDDRAITVDKVSVYYSTPNDNINIRDITVTGGGRTQGLQGFDSRRLFNNHTVNEDPDNAWMLNSPITMGLGRNNSVLISVEVGFGIEGEITFTAAGIHYSVPR